MKHDYLIKVAMQLIILMFLSAVVLRKFPVVFLDE